MGGYFGLSSENIGDTNPPRRNDKSAHSEGGIVLLSGDAGEYVRVLESTSKISPHFSLGNHESRSPGQGNVWVSR